MQRRYWLMKTEPGTYSIDDLERDDVAEWDGVRNYQARNFMRNDMQIGDGVLIYHSVVLPMGVYGIAEVASQSYPDLTQFDPASKYCDPKSDPDNPRWWLVDVRFVKKFGRSVALSIIRQMPGLEQMVLLQKGNRLSIQPVRSEEWEIIVQMGLLPG